MVGGGAISECLRFLLLGLVLRGIVIAIFEEGTAWWVSLGLAKEMQMTGDIELGRIRRAGWGEGEDEV